MATAVAADPVVTTDKESAAAKLMASPEVVHSNYVPAQLHRQLEFLDFNSDGHLILGCSDLTGRNWTGSLWYYRDPAEAPSVEKALTGVECDQGLVDGRFVSKNRLIVALDNGSVEQISLSFSDEAEHKVPSFFYLEREHSVQEHDDIITGFDITCDNKFVVTSSYDHCLVCLDLETLRLDSRINDAHGSLISNLSTNKKIAYNCVTSGNDGRVKSWDLRSSSEQQSCIYNDTSNWPTCVEWLPNSEHHLLVGTQTGRVFLYDSRRSKDPLISEDCLNGQIHQFKFSPKRANLFSVSGDDVSVKAFEVNETFDKIVEKLNDGKHGDFVRGMVWHPMTGKLYSCGWDHQVLSHDVAN